MSTDDCVRLGIRFNIRSNEYTIDSLLTKEGVVELLEEYLRRQIGTGRDEREPIIKDAYNITLHWYPRDDRISSSYDTNNKGLRDGILLYVLGAEKK